MDSHIIASKKGTPIYQNHLHSFCFFPCRSRPGTTLASAASPAFFKPPQRIQRSTEVVAQGRAGGIVHKDSRSWFIRNSICWRRIPGPRLVVSHRTDQSHICCVQTNSFWTATSQETIPLVGQCGHPFQPFVASKDHHGADSAGGSSRGRPGASAGASAGASGAPNRSFAAH